MLDVQDKVKQLPVTTNVGLKNGAMLVERLGFMLELTLDFAANSYKRLSGYVKQSVNRMLNS